MQLTIAVPFRSATVAFRDSVLRLLSELAPLGDEVEVLILAQSSTAPAAQALTRAFADRRLRSYVPEPDEPFPGLAAAQGALFWPFDSRDRVNVGAIDSLRRLLAQTPDVVLSEGAAANGAPSLSGALGPPPRGGRHRIDDLVRETGFFALCDRSGVIFRRERMLAVLRRSGRKAPGLDRAGWVYAAFARSPILSLERGLIAGSGRAPDDDRRADFLAAVPRIAGLQALGFPATLLTDLIDLGRQRRALAEQVAAALIAQLREAILHMRAEQLILPRDAASLLDAYATASPALFAAVQRILDVNDACGPYLRMISARRAYHRPPPGDAQLTRTMLAFGESRFEQVFNRIRHGFICVLDAAEATLMQEPLDLVFVSGLEKQGGVFAYAGRHYRIDRRNASVRVDARRVLPQAGVIEMTGAPETT